MIISKTKRNLQKAIRLFLLLTLFSCASYQQFQYLSEEYEIPSQVFKTDFNQTWQAAIEVMKNHDLAVQSQESGVIKTRWQDNTLALNFADSFGSSDSVKAAKYKLIVNVNKGFRGTREVAKVTVFKRQMVENDFLQGWKTVGSDGIIEKTILYRIERLLKIEEKLKKIEEAKSKELESSF